MPSTNSFDAHGELNVGDASYEVYRVSAVEGHESLPYSLKVLLENLLRTEDGANITADHIRALGGWDENADPDTEIPTTSTPAPSPRMARPAVKRAICRAVTASVGTPLSTSKASAVDTAAWC